MVHKARMALAMGWRGIHELPDGVLADDAATVGQLNAAIGSHTHAIADITGLQTALDGKQALDADLTSLAALSTTGIVSRTASSTFATRELTGTANQVLISNGTGAGGNPTFSLPQNIHTGAAPTFAGLTINGRIKTIAHEIGHHTEQSAFYRGKWTSDLASWTARGKTAPTITYGGGATFSAGSIRSVTEPFISHEQTFNVALSGGASSAAFEFNNGSAFPARSRAIWAWGVEFRGGSQPTSILVEGYNNATASWTTLVNDTAPLFIGGLWVSAEASVVFFSTFTRVRFTLSWSAGSTTFLLAALVQYHRNIPFGQDSLPGLHTANAFTAAQTMPSLTVGALSGYVKASAGAFSGQTGVPWGDITSKPTTLSGYGITDAQPLDADLTSLAALSTTGWVVRSASNTFLTRELIAGTGIGITNSTGAGGNPTISLGAHSHAISDITGLQTALDGKAGTAHTHAISDITGLQTALDGKQPLDADLTSLAALSTTGIVSRTASNTFATRELTGTANQVLVANGTGAGGNPTFSLPQNIHTGASPTFTGLNLTNTIGIPRGDLGNLAPHLSRITGSGWTYTAGVGPAGAGYLSKISGGSTVALSGINDLIPVGPNEAFDFSYALGLGNSTGNARLALRPYDRLGNIIQSHHVICPTNTLTTLATDLNPGDTTITLTSATNWQTTPATSRLIGFNPVGHADYGVHGGYTRLVGNTAGHATSPSSVTGDYTSIASNVLTLAVPWVGPAYAAGTPVGNYRFGVTFVYPNLTALPGAAWQHVRGTIRPMPSDGRLGTEASRMWPGAVGFTVGFFFDSLTAASVANLQISRFWGIREGSAAAPAFVVDVPGASSPNTGWWWDTANARLAYSHSGTNTLAFGTNAGAALQVIAGSLQLDPLTPNRPMWLNGDRRATTPTTAQFLTDIGAQPLDADLTSLAALSSTGWVVRTTTDTFAVRTLEAGTGIAISNPTGAGGNPVISLSSPSVAWGDVTGKPNSFDGYEITGTRRYSKSALVWNFRAAQIIPGLSVRWLRVPYNPSDGSSMTFDIEEFHAEVYSTVDSSAGSTVVKLQKASDPNGSFSDLTNSTLTLASTGGFEFVEAETETISTTVASGDRLAVNIVSTTDNETLGYGTEHFELNCHVMLRATA